MSVRRGMVSILACGVTRGQHVRRDRYEAEWWMVTTLTMIRMDVLAQRIKEDRQQFVVAFLVLRGIPIGRIVQICIKRPQDVWRTYKR